MAKFWIGLPLLVLIPLAGCGGKPPQLPPFTVQAETIDEASFSPSIEVVSVLTLFCGMIILHSW